MKYLIQVLIDGKWQTGPVFPRPIGLAQTTTCDGILYGLFLQDRHYFN